MKTYAQLHRYYMRHFFIEMTDRSLADLLLNELYMLDHNYIEGYIK